MLVKRLAPMALLALSATSPALAQTASPYQFSPDEFRYLSNGEIEQSLIPRTGHDYSGNTVNRHETYWVEFMKRFDHGNLIEFHSHWVDYITVMAGEGTVTYGGTVAGATPAGPGEMRGGTMTGGTVQPLKAGDYVLIPAGVSHIINASQGKELKYVIFKHRV